MIHAGKVEQVLVAGDGVFLDVVVGVVVVPALVWIQEHALGVMEWREVVDHRGVSERLKAGGDQYRGANDDKQTMREGCGFHGVLQGTSLPVGGCLASGG